MSLTFRQWQGHAQKADIKRVIWCYGDQPVLIEDVVDTVRRLIAPSDLDYVTLEAGAVSDADVWAAASQYPLVPGTSRLVIVRQAQRITNLFGLLTILKERRLNPRAYLLFVSDKSEPPKEIVPPRGHVIRCKQMSLVDLAWWAKTLAPLSDATAEYLAARSAGNMQQLKSVSYKLALFDGTPSNKIIDELCSESPAEDFIDLLMQFQRREALAVAELVSSDEYRGILRLLDFRLTVMQRLNWAVRTELNRREISALPDVPYFLADRFMSVAKYYETARCEQRRNVLVMLDDALNAGSWSERDGVLETLVALW